MRMRTGSELASLFDIKWLCISHLVLRLAKTSQSRQHEDEPASVDVDPPVRASGPRVHGIRAFPQCTAESIPRCTRRRARESGALLVLRSITGCVSYS